ncbi:hypothetical protein ACE193_07315 [Bernardetia sp. OM2101]|uniref:hypothetical protein n=1 Tax=Bernardetia sp. OM2101 TaxID=3344876 RepID=UPI0035CEF712
MKQELKNKQGDVYYTVEYLKDQNIVKSVWIGKYLPIEDIKTAALLGLSFFKKYKATKILNDNKKLEGSWDEANEWIAKRWTPQATEAGLVKLAHVVADEILAKFSAKFMKMENDLQDTTFQLKLFDNEKEALEWLEK